MICFPHVILLRQQKKKVKKIKRVNWYLTPDFSQMRSKITIIAAFSMFEGYWIKNVSILKHSEQS